MPKVIPIEDRLRKYTSRNPESGCMEWTGGKNWAGYGMIGINKKMKLVHRVVWELENGSIPKGDWVLHKCDNPACSNVSHLFLGNRADNIADMVAKKRQLIGERNTQAKLCEREVKEIRSDTRTGKQIAAAYRVSPQLINKIKLRLNWKHVA